MPIRRRALLETAAAAALGSTLGCNRGAADSTAAAALEAPLLPDPKGLLELPPGFSYRIIQRTGDRMSDGYRVPGRPDAMGCFDGARGAVVLMRNHEMTAGDSARSPYFPGQDPPPEAYDPDGTGGVTRMVLDADTLEVRRTNLVLAGTYWNCAGGLSPWGWLTCEETVDDPRHGYVFLCTTDAERVQRPRRIVGYGRMRHEAASVDRRTHIAYLTEDRPDGCFYRFVPHDRPRPFDGVFQALTIEKQPGFDTSTLPVRKRLAVEWIDVAGADSADDSVRARAFAKGAALVRRGEGLWLTHDAAYFTATIGGPGGRGQVFRLGLGKHATLEVIADGSDANSLDMPDNVCVSPQGHVYVAEDGSGENYLRRIGLDGRVHPFARNVGSSSEFAGPCFTPDGRTLFVNLQGDGLTFAIRGPFERPLSTERDCDEDPRGPRHPSTHPLRGAGGGLALLALAAIQVRRRGSGR